MQLGLWVLGNAIGRQLGSLLIIQEGMTSQCIPNRSSSQIALQRHLLLLSDCVENPNIQRRRLSCIAMTSLQLFRSCKAMLCLLEVI